jgi:hypothetical protein
MAVFFSKIKFHILHQKQKFLLKLHGTRDESLINQSVIKMIFYCAKAIPATGREGQ